MSKKQAHSLFLFLIPNRSRQSVRRKTKTFVNRNGVAKVGENDFHLFYIRTVVMLLREDGESRKYQDFSSAGSSLTTTIDVS